MGKIIASRSLTDGPRIVESKVRVLINNRIGDLETRSKGERLIVDIKDVSKKL